MKYEPKTKPEERVVHVFGEVYPECSIYPSVACSLCKMKDDLAHAEAVIEWQDGEIKRLKHGISLDLPTMEEVAGGYR